MSVAVREELSERVRREGFAVVPGVLDEHALSSFEESLAAIRSGAGVLTRGGIYAIRHLLEVLPAAPWKVAWHQDLTIAVRERIEMEGFGPWSVKAGVVHFEFAAAPLPHGLEWLA